MLDESKANFFFSNSVFMDFSKQSKDESTENTENGGEKERGVQRKEFQMQLPDDLLGLNFAYKYGSSKIHPMPVIPEDFVVNEENMSPCQKNILDRAMSGVDLSELRVDSLTTDAQKAIQLLKLALQNDSDSGDEHDEDDKEAQNYQNSNNTRKSFPQNICFRNLNSNPVKEDKNNISIHGTTAKKSLFGDKKHKTELTNSHISSNKSDVCISIDRVLENNDTKSIKNDLNHTPFFKLHPVFLYLIFYSLLIELIALVALLMFISKFKFSIVLFSIIEILLIFIFLFNICIGMNKSLLIQQYLKSKKPSNLSKSKYDGQVVIIKGYVSRLVNQLPLKNNINIPEWILVETSAKMRHKYFSVPGIWIDAHRRLDMIDFKITVPLTGVSVIINKDNLFEDQEEHIRILTNYTKDFYPTEGYDSFSESDEDNFAIKISSMKEKNNVDVCMVQNCIAEDQEVIAMGKLHEVDNKLVLKPIEKSDHFSLFMMFFNIIPVLFASRISGLFISQL